MLPRQFRIVKDQDFQLILKKGRGFRRPEGQIKVLQNNLKHNRFGIIISNKVAKRANQRNLLKRRTRDIFRGFIPQLCTGFDIVFIAYPPIVNKDFDELKEFLTGLFFKMYLLNSNGRKTD